MYIYIYMVYVIYTDSFFYWAEAVSLSGNDTLFEILRNLKKKIEIYSVGVIQHLLLITIVYILAIDKGIFLMMRKSIICALI